MSVEAVDLQRARETGVDLSLLSPPSAADYASVQKVKHFYGMDILRSLAAVVVLIWHYQYFFTINPSFERTDQPLYWLFMPFYEHGYWAVGGFWVISGFVFAHVYGDREVKAAEFVASRFARLYPLHFITLLVTGAIQVVSFSLLGRYTIEHGNSMTDFVRHLFFMGGWWAPYNFNSPIWSVSVELVIYAVFFVLARRIFSFGLLISTFIVISMAMLVNEQSPVDNFHLCAFFFFTGCALYYWLIKFRDRPAILFLPAVVSAGFFTYYVGAGLLPHMRFYDVQFFLFPPIILVVGWLDFQPGIQKRLKPLKWFGDTTYSSYLWHYPIAVATVVLFSYLGWTPEVFRNPVLLFVWVVGMVALAHFSFVYVEKPLQRFCLSTFKRVRSTGPRP